MAVRPPLTPLAFALGCLASGGPPCAAAPALRILAHRTQAGPRGVSVTRYTIGLVGGPTARAARRVAVVVRGPTHPGAYAPVPAVYVNGDASLMAIQSMPYWGETGRRRYGRRITLVVATPGRRIRVIGDFSARLNRLARANVSRWEGHPGHYHRPASDMVMSALIGRHVFVTQYTPDPQIGLPEYVTVGATVSPSGDLKFFSFTSQGF